MALNNFTRKDEIGKNELMAQALIEQRHGSLEVPSAPKTHKWTEDEKAWVIAMLVEADGDTAKAYKDLMLLREKHPEYNIYLPAIESEAVRSIQALKRTNRKAIVQHAVDNIVVWKFIKLAREGDGKTAMEAARELWDRDEGKPTQHVQQQIVTCSWAEIEARRQEAIKQADGEWVAESEDHAECPPNTEDK